MAKKVSKTDVPEKRGRGRPRTNPVSMHLTLLPGAFAALDEFADRDGLSRLEACRRLIALGLQVVERRLEVAQRRKR